MRPDAQRRPILFIDDGGVMNDNVPRGAEWRRLVAEFFPPLLGGEAAKWQEANRATLGRLEPYMIDGPQRGQDYASWQQTYQLGWLRGMAEFVGVACPAEDGRCIELTWKAADYITHRVQSAFPGATDAIRTLYSNGFQLFTASGEHSRELDGYLKAMGVRECFRTLYGADLVNQAKYSAEFYRRLFEHSSVGPGNALIVDDQARCLDWAATLGAATCLVGPESPGTSRFTLRVPSLAELPSALEKLA